MGQMLNRRRVIGGNLLPGGGKRVKWITSNGNQWIDTGIVLTPTMRMEVGFYYMEPQEYSKGICGATFNGNMYSLSILGYNGTRCSFNFRTSTNGLFQIVNNDYNYIEVIIEGNIAKYRRSHIGDYSSRQSSGSSSFSLGGKTCYVFAVNNPKGGNIDMYPAELRMEFFRLADGDTILADYIPAELGGVGCMFDNVTETYKMSAGSEDFGI